MILNHLNYNAMYLKSDPHLTIFCHIRTAGLGGIPYKSFEISKGVGAT